MHAIRRSKTASLLTCLQTAEISQLCYLAVGHLLRLIVLTTIAPAVLQDIQDEPRVLFASAIHQSLQAAS